MKQTIVTPENKRTRHIRVYCNGEDIGATTFQALLPIEPNVEVDGWADRYMTNAKGAVIAWIINHEC